MQTLAIVLLVASATLQTHSQKTENSFGVPSVGLNNEIVGVPEVVCGEDSISFTVKTRNAFRGNLYVRGQYNVPQCRQEFFNNNYNGATFTVRINECGMTRVRQLEPHGMTYVLVFVTNFHPQFMTMIDRAYNVRCFYAQVDKQVDSELEVNGIPTEPLDQSTTVMPQCVYSIRAGDLQGKAVQNVMVGDITYHVWQCNNSNYGMLVKNCFANGTDGSSVQVLDARGCQYNDSPMGVPEYTEDLSTAYIKVPAYKLPDQSRIFFQCQIQVCKKNEKDCVGVTPPNCPKVKHNDFFPNSIVNANVNPTEVVATFEEKPPSTSQPVFIPEVRSSNLNANQPFQGAGTRHFDQAPPDDVHRFRPFAPNMIPSERIQALQHVNQPYFRKKDSPPIPEGRNDSADDAVVHFDAQHDLTSAPIILKKNPYRLTDPMLAQRRADRVMSRMRRDEENTLDVMAESIYVADREVADFEQAPIDLANMTEVLSGTGSTRYCVEHNGVVTGAVLFSLLCTVALAMSIYICYDISFKKAKRKKGLISARRPPPPMTTIPTAFGGRIRPFDTEINQRLASDVFPMPRIATISQSQ